MQKANNIVIIFMEEVFKLDEILKSIMPDRDAKLTSNFWKGFIQYLATQINFCLVYHP